MNEKTQLGVRVLAAALAAGVLGDALLRVGPPGINVFVWAALLVALVLALRNARPVVSRADDAFAAFALLAFAAFFAWRDSPVLKLLDLGALGIVVSLAALRAPVRGLADCGLFDYAKGSLLAAFRAAVGAFLLVFGDIEWSETVRAGWPRRALGVMCGTLLAVPPLIVFGSLLMSADAVFRKIVVESIFFNIPKFISHVFLIAFFGWIVGGTLRAIVVEKDGPLPGVARPRFFSLGITEISVALGLVDLLFLAFVWVEFRYFFGGSSLVQVTPGLTYAEYARHGFFELAAVSAFALQLLLGAHWLLRKESLHQERIFRSVAGTMVLLLFVIMASAAGRMRLYQQEYGLTELRVYTSAFIGWLAIVFVWFVLTVLRGYRERFAFGAMLAGFAMIVALHALNPDALIARTNVERARAGQQFDARYVARLSADAVPTLVTSLSELNRQDGCDIAQRLFKRWLPSESTGWRTWSWSRAQARWAVQANEGNLRSLPCPPEKD